MKKLSEKRAVEELQNLADRWPQSLVLFSAAGSLVVVRAGWSQDKGADGVMIEDDVIARIHGIPNDGGDPW